MEHNLRINADLVRAYGPGLISFAQRAVHSRADAEDLVQEMWIGALGAAERFEGRASVRTWLTSILRRRMADKYRRKVTLLELDDDSFCSDEETLEQLIAHETMQQLRARMHELNELEARALTLYLDDVDRDHACAQLGVTRGHLRVLLHRARAKLLTL